MATAKTMGRAKARKVEPFRVRQKIMNDLRTREKVCLLSNDRSETRDNNRHGSFLSSFMDDEAWIEESRYKEPGTSHTVRHVAVSC